jgi:CubicO group peptidase (beta-lactamase class C family)
MNMVLFWVFAALLQPPSSASRGFVSKADRYMHAQAHVNGFTGSVLVAKDGNILLSKEYRSRALESRVPDTTETRFRVGSIAKQFTDLAILQLQERGRLQVRDSVCTYIKNCPDDWAKITLFDLMTNTYGIPAISTFSAGRSPSISTLVDEIKKEPLRSEPTGKFDSGYSAEEVLEAVVEAVSSEPYQTYLRTHIFAPAGMVNTGYDGRLRTLSRPQELSVLLPSDVQESLFYTAGGIYSTTRDLYLWYRALATAKLVSAKSLKQMFTPYKDGYGFGWMIQKEIGRKLLTQAVGLSTYSSSILYYPDNEVCIIVLSQSEETDGQKIGRDLAAIFFGDHYELPARHKVITLNPTTYATYVGRYSIASKFVLRVTRDNHGLLIGRSGLAETELFPESKTMFFLKGSDAKIVFVMGPSGRASQLVLQEGGRDIPAQRLN